MTDEGRVDKSKATIARFIYSINSILLFVEK